MSARDYTCDAPRCPLARPEAACDKWRGSCKQGAFRALVAGFSGYGDWTVHEWSVGSGKYYAKLFGRTGFVTIEDYKFRGCGYAVRVRLRQPRGEAEWRERKGLSAEDGSLAEAVAWGCALAGTEGV